MSIFDELGREGPAGARLFADRFELSREFAERIHAQPPPRTVAFYVAAGGNGKSALLRHLRDHCCVRLPPAMWDEVRAAPPELFVDKLGRARRAKRIPCALLDFSTTPFDGTRPQEALGALFLVKRQLAEFGIKTPRFDFAAVAYLHKTGSDVQRLIRDNFPNSELAVAATIADAFIALPVFQVGTALVAAMRNRMSDLLSQRRLQRRVPDEDVLEEVLRMPPDPDLMAALPRYFAADLATALKADADPGRIVLLFDTFEALTGETTATRFVDRGGPRWFRQLIGRLPLDDGLIVGIASRSYPGWAEALTDPIPDRFVSVTALGALPVEYADQYLRQAGIDDAAVRAILLQYATIEPDQVHPLLLGLCTDVALAAAERGTAITPDMFADSDALADKERELAARLMQWVSGNLEQAIVAASAARAFDEEVFRHLGGALGFPAGDEPFRQVTAFSFVSAVGERWAIHLLLRRALRRVAPQIVAAAHRALADYYRSVPPSDAFAARLERIYHEARLDPGVGIQMWREEMGTALSQSRFDRCRSLITLLRDIEALPQPDVEAATYLAADAEIALGDHTEAQRLLDSLPAQAPYALLLRANLAFARSDFAAAETLSEQALAAVDADASRLPFLFRAAELRLFLGRFGKERSFARRDWASWATTAPPTICLLGTPCWPGSASSAATSRRPRRSWCAPKSALDTAPESSWDKSVEAVVRVNEAVVAEAEDRPHDAHRGQDAALQIYREVSDVGGIANATNGLGLAALQLRDHVEAMARFTEAARIARDLGDAVLYAKTQRGQGRGIRYWPGTSTPPKDSPARRRRASSAAVSRTTWPMASSRPPGCNMPAATTPRGCPYWTEPGERSSRMASTASIFAARKHASPRPTASPPPFAPTWPATPWESRGKAARPRTSTSIGCTSCRPAMAGRRAPRPTTPPQMMLVSRLLVDTSGRPTAEEFMRRLSAAAHRHPRHRTDHQARPGAVRRRRLASVAAGRPERRRHERGGHADRPGRMDRSRNRCRPASDPRPRSGSGDPPVPHRHRGGPARRGHGDLGSGRYRHDPVRRGRRSRMARPAGVRRRAAGRRRRLDPTARRRRRSMPRRRSRP